MADRTPSLFGSDALVWTPGDGRRYKQLLSRHSDARFCQSVDLILLKGIRRCFIQGAITHLMTHSQVCVCREAMRSWTPVTLLGNLLQTGGCVGAGRAALAAFLEHGCNQSAGWHTLHRTLPSN